MVLHRLHPIPSVVVFLRGRRSTPPCLVRVTRWWKRKRTLPTRWPTPLCIHPRRLPLQMVQIDDGPRRNAASCMARLSRTTTTGGIHLPPCPPPSNGKQEEPRQRVPTRRGDALVRPLEWKPRCLPSRHFLQHPSTHRLRSSSRLRFLLFCIRLSFSRHRVVVGRIRRASGSVRPLPHRLVWAPLFRLVVCRPRRRKGSGERITLRRPSLTSPTTRHSQKRGRRGTSTMGAYASSVHCCNSTRKPCEGLPYNKSNGTPFLFWKKRTKRRRRRRKGRFSVWNHLLSLPTHTSLLLFQGRSRHWQCRRPPPFPRFLGPPPPLTGRRRPACVPLPPMRRPFYLSIRRRKQSGRCPQLLSWKRKKRVSIILLLLLRHRWFITPLWIP